MPPRKDKLGAAGERAESAWDKRVETDDDACAAILAAFEYGATKQEVVDIVNGLGKGYVVTFDDLRRRLARKDVGGEGALGYARILFKNHPLEHVMERQRKRVREHLIRSKSGRTYSWRLFPDTRAIVVAMLEKGRAGADIARAMTQHLKLDPPLDRGTVESTIMNGGGPVAFAETLRRGLPPFRRALTGKDMERGVKDADNLYEAGQRRLSENKGSWTEREDTREFVLALLQYTDMPPIPIFEYLRRKFKMDKLYSHSGLYHAINQEAGETSRERRDAFVAKKRRGEDSSTSAKMFREQMKEAALQAWREYAARVRDTRLASLAQALGRYDEYMEDKAYEAEFREQVLALRPVLIRHAAGVLLRGRSVGAEEAEDLAQEAIDRALGKRELFERGTNLEGWLKKIMTNLYIDKLRAEKARPQIAQGEGAEIAYDNAAADQDMEGDIARKQLVERMREAMEELPEGQRRALELFHIEELPQKEVAEQMGISEDAVQSLLWRARKTLAEKMRGEDPDDE